jgi:hypothetical protein
MSRGCAEVAGYREATLPNGEAQWRDRGVGGGVWEWHR